MNRKLRLINTLSIQSVSYNQFRMFAYIIRQVKAIGADYKVVDGNIYVTKGQGLDGFPCMVSHMDTVHEIVSDLTVIELNGRLTGMNKKTMEQTGIGGDDKVGVFVTLELLREVQDMKAVFFRDEEVGCEGSYLSDVDFFHDVNFVLQCDRKGNKDFVTNAAGTGLASKAWKKAMRPILKDYGYSFCDNGGMTDVMALKENGVSCAMANISCGYYKPHTSKEYVNISHVMNVFDMCLTIFNKYGNQHFPHTYSPSTYSYGYTKGSYGYNKSYYGGSTSTTSINGSTWNDKHETWEAFCDRVERERKASLEKDWSKYMVDHKDEVKKKADITWVDCECCGNLTKDKNLTYIPSYRINVCDTCLEYANSLESNGGFDIL